MRLIDAHRLYGVLLYDLGTMDSEEFEKAVFKRITNAPTVDGWTPCSERLPECNGRYLVTNEAWGANEIEINVWKHGEWYYNTKPIAWMPLPKPYAERKTNE